MRFTALISVFCALATIALPTTAATFGERLKALSEAVDQHLQSSDASSFPPELRRVAWIYLVGDRTPDAVVVLRRTQSECAIQKDARTMCRALLLKGVPDGGFEVMSTFLLAGHPLVLSGRNGFDTVYVPLDPEGSAPYQKFGVEGSSLQERTPGYRYTADQAQADGSIEFDDRIMPTMANQQYIAQNFKGSGSARLAPGRISYDGINVSLARSDGRKKKVDVSLIEKVGSELQSALSPDVSKVTSALGWPFTLEARLWDCLDWMVVRKFWEVEGKRLGKIGVCVDGLAFGLQQGSDKISPADLVLAARYRLLQEVGIAYILRLHPNTVKVRNSQKTGDADELQRAGAAAGVLLGHRLGLQSQAESQRAREIWNTIIEMQFDLVERRMGFMVKSSELTGFSSSLATRHEAGLCAWRYLKQPVPPKASPCDVKQGEIKLSALIVKLDNDINSKLLP